MKFLVDAHRPPGLCAALQAAGHDAIHTRQLSALEYNSLVELDQEAVRVVA